MMDKTVKSRYFEGCGKEGPILCIFVCEFHSTYGPKISCQVPKDFISKETFESVNVYLIPKPQLIRSLITVTLDDIKIVGYPVRIESEVYPRNAFYYNLCFVCDSWARTNQYDQVVKDFSAYLRQLEEDENFLSKMDISGDSSQIISLLNQVLNDLNTTRISSLQHGKRSVRLRVGRYRDVYIPLNNVPVPVLSDNMDLSSWRQSISSDTDESTTKILQHVDGLNNVEKIVNLSNIESNQVKNYLHSLINDGVIKLISEYNETNCYVVTSGVRRLVMDKQLQSLCISQVSSNQGGSLANIKDIIRIYCSLHQGATVKDLCFRYDMNQMKIDERKLIQFGLFHQIIRKLNKFVNYTGEYVEEVNNVGDTISTTSSGSMTDKDKDKEILIKMNGRNSIEEMLLNMSVPHQHIDYLIKTNHDIICILK